MFLLSIARISGTTTYNSKDNIRNSIPFCLPEYFKRFWRAAPKADGPGKRQSQVLLFASYKISAGVTHDPGLLFSAIGTSQADSQSRPASRNSRKQQKWLRLGFRTLRLRYFTIRSITASSKLRVGEAEPREAILFVTGPAVWDRSIVLSSFRLSALSCLIEIYTREGSMTIRAGWG
jgi:hypothetical protein